MEIHYFIQALFVLVGLLSLLAAICNWNWFFTAQNTQFIVRNVGRKQARWFYALIGLLMIGTGVFFSCPFREWCKTNRVFNSLLITSTGY